MQKDYLELVKKLDSKINDVEKLIQLLLINNLIDDVEDTIDISKKCIDERVNEKILKNGLEFEGFNKINDIEVITLNIPEGSKITIKTVKQVQIIVNKVYPDAEPLFMYSRMNGMQRKSFLQNNISFGIKGKEIRLIRGVK